jgi:hypothetical protein
MKTPSRSWIIDEWVPFILATFTEDGLYGIANKHGILVDKSLDNQNLVSTAIHEQFHKVMNKTGATDILSDDVAEMVCRNVELLFVSLLNDEEMLAWMMYKWSKR